MENWTKDRLISEIMRSSEKLSFYQIKLRDLVTAYKSLLKEKEALESSLKALQNVCQTDTQNTANKNIEMVSDVAEESLVDQEKETNFNTEIATLMNSLATLSEEKCRMEASFQADRKYLRQEKDRCDLVIKDLEEKLKKLTYSSAKEIDQLKSKLNIEKHEREKEQNNNVIMMSELQRLLSQEKEEKLVLEKRLSELTPKFELLVNKEEIERYKERDITEKFVHLQKKHLTVIEEERKRLQQTEQESKEQIAIHEQRVANLETRLTELSLTVANYHKLRQEDQNEITKLKAHIAELDSQTKISECLDICDFDAVQNNDDAYIKSIIDKLIKYKALLLNASQHFGKSIEIHSILCDKCNSYDVHSVNLDVHRKLLTEYETLMQQFKESSKTIDEMENFKIKIQVLESRNSILITQLEEVNKKYDLQVNTLHEQMNLLNQKHSKDIDSLHNTYKVQILELENQLQKQRDRSLALLDEKEQEVTTLKSSFQMFLPSSQQNVEHMQNSNSVQHSQLSGVLDGTLEVSTGESPHILHYAHELARRDVEITNLKKNCNQLESMLHDVNKELILCKEKNREESTRLNEIISRLERCQTREGANLEYLKNVIVNYFLSQNSSSKRHMFNAIATVLKFSDTEIREIKRKL